MLYFFEGPYMTIDVFSSFAETIGMKGWTGACIGWATWILSKEGGSIITTATGAQAAAACLATVPG